jgi:cation diffusion facilitator family transporter
MWQVLTLYAITLVLKLVGFAISGYLILLADAFHTLTDIASILVLAYSGVLSRKPADSLHPFGHGMVKNVASLVVGVSFITIISFELFKEGVIKIFNPATLYANTQLVLVIEFAVLAILALTSIIYSRKSGILNRTVFVETLNDSLSTVAAIVGIVLVSLGNPIFDGVTAILISLMIFYNSVRLVRQNARFLLGLSPPDEFYQKVERELLSFDSVKGVHDMISTYIGEREIHLDMHVTIDGDTTIAEADELSVRIVERLKKELPEIKHVSVHFCPHHGEMRKRFEK